MSGGSYDYLYIKDIDELLHSHHQENIEGMAARLAGLGYAQDAAEETESVLLILRQFQVRMQARLNRLSGVWKAVEWWDSCDWNEDSVKEALAEYRKDGAL
jgi:hypothetical protein